MFQISWHCGGFSFPSLRERQNMFVIRTVLDMMISQDEIPRKLIKQFEKEQAENLHIEWLQRDENCQTGFLNWQSMFKEMEVNPHFPTQSFFASILGTSGRQHLILDP
jgi:hypothetical protein